MQRLSGEKKLGDNGGALRRQPGPQSDASVAPHWDDINRYLGAFIPPRAFEGTFKSSGSITRPAWIYAVRTDGHLGWYRHNGAELGSGADKPGAWVGGEQGSGPGWGGMKQILPGGGNVIYAIANDGRLYWYGHRSYGGGASFKTASYVARPQQVGHGWGEFPQVIALLPGMPDAVR